MHRPTAPAGLNRRAGLAALAAMSLSGCSASGLLNTFVPRASYRGRQDIAYGPDPRQKLDTYQPLESRGLAPLVIFFYGGSWTRGDRADYRFVGEALAAHGAVAVLPDYRLSPQVRYPVFLEDSARAVQWAVRHAPELGCDPRKIYLMGHSAGAYNAAMLALDPRWLATVGLAPGQFAGWIGIAGPYDFLPIENPEAQVAFHWPSTPADSQPLAQATAAAPRTLLLAPEKDSLVNPRRSTMALGEKLKSLGVDARWRLLDGVSHITIMASLAKPLSWLSPVRAEVLAFLGLQSPPMS
ncbi:alpha/beta hydrolase [Caenimonas aquaedulcis]|uniref:Alpha/beta hydrolase n=1 Tax=Caenimonas aquaedulcis TaxID=2793270 RepID=A0A931MHC9_9BURK|nr:alpha/beta hydrolase [Caenimonas aquaedulcis]MBG9388832.1 alpha/beta hydrolase [Caenimonas aquaedulcis]